MSRILSLFGAALCAAVVLGAGLPQCPGAVMSSAEKKIEEALASPTELEFKDMPLQDVLEYLRDYHGIRIALDEKALGDVGIAKDTPVTEKLHQVSLRSALELTLGRLDLTYLVRHEVLLITTKEEAGSEACMSTKVYPVDDLIGRYSPAPDEKVQGELADFDSMIETITSTVRPASWDDVGGPGSIAAVTTGGVESLVISQTYHVHRRIAALLEQLRAVAMAKQEAATAGRRSAPTAYRSRSAGEEKIEKALKSPTRLNLPPETPLEDVLDHLEQFHKIEIEIDTRALGDVGVGTDTPITKELEEISLQSALRLMLGDLGLTYIIENEVLLITTKEEAESEAHMSTVLYPVDDLTSSGNSRGPGAADLKALSGVITSTIQPTTWEDVGGPGSMVGISLGGVSTLVISQTQDVHEEIVKLLVECRKVAGAKQRNVTAKRQPAQTAHGHNVFVPKKIAKALESLTQLEFHETPLEDVVDSLKRLHEIDIQIDVRALADVGMGVDTPITKSLRGISLRSALRLMLHELGLTYIIDKEMLLITIKEE